MKKLSAVLCVFALLLFASCKADDYRGADTSTATQAYTKLDMDGLASLNDGELPDINYSNNDTIEYIDGVIAGFPVYSSEEAYEAIKDASDLLGIRDIETEIKFDSFSANSVDNVFFFSQYYNDIRIIGASVTVIANKETGVADYLYSTYRNDMSIDTVPTVSSNDAVNIIEIAYGVNAVGAPELVISSVDTKSDEVVLTWEIKTGSQTPSVVYVDAHSGQVVYAQMKCDES